MAIIFLSLFLLILSRKANFLREHLVHCLSYHISFQNCACLLVIKQAWRNKFQCSLFQTETSKSYALGNGIEMYLATSTSEYSKLVIAN